MEKESRFSGKIKNPCAKCIQPVERDQKEFPPNSTEPKIPKSSSENCKNLSEKSSSENHAEKCYCEGFLCEELFHAENDSPEEKNGDTGVWGTRKKFSVDEGLEKMAPKRVYTEEEIKKYVSIIEQALRDEMARRFSLPSRSSTEESDDVQVCELRDSEIDSRGSDDISLDKIRSLVLDQYSLIRYYQDNANPQRPCNDLNDDYDVYESFKSLIEMSDFSRSDEFESKNRLWCWDDGENEAYDGNWLTPWAYEYLEDFPRFLFEGEGKYSFGEEGEEDRSKSVSDEVGNCGETSKSCKLRDPLSVSFFNEALSRLECKQVQPFVIGYQGKSDLIGKWGDCLDIVDQVLSECDMSSKNGMRAEENSKSLKKLEEHDEEKTLSCIRYDDFHETDSTSGMKCHLPIPNHSAKTEASEMKSRSHLCHEIPGRICPHTDNFDNLKRFDKIGTRGVASLCRKLTKWTHCVTKTLCEIREHPHIVVQMPSFSYPKALRKRARLAFRSFQNSQFGRLSWLENKNAQVLYVCPSSDGSDNLENILRDFIRSVRPDVCLDNLWILRSKKSQDSENFEKDCSSGIENIFSNPCEYRRLRYLTAGRQAFILPGVMQKKDVFVACELKMAIMGVPWKCQESFMAKSEFMKLLKELNIDCPPTLEVNKYDELCSGLARMIIEYPEHDTWFVKINIGFNGCHTAVYKSHNTSCHCQFECQTKLCGFLYEILPARLQLKSDVYKDVRHFIHDLECHGK